MKSDPSVFMALKVFIGITMNLTVMVGCLLTNSSIAQSIGLLNESIVIVNPSEKKSKESEPLIIRKCDDFTLTGKGNNPEWNKAEWTRLTKLDEGGREYESKFKVLYSATGIYLHFYGQDDKITTKDYNDFENIFNGDVFEVFFHTNPAVMVYFEYEVNQMDKELILTISNLDGQSYTSWAPRQRAGKNQSGIKKMVDVIGGEKEVNGTIRSWSAEIFFPYGALGLLPNVPPKSGSYWNANFCRLDYDTGKMVKWSWTPTIENSFHELDKFLSIKFE